MGMFNPRLQVLPCGAQVYGWKKNIYNATGAVSEPKKNSQISRITESLFLLLSGKCMMVSEFGRRSIKTQFQMARCRPLRGT